MKKALLTLALFLTASGLFAADLEPVIWTNTSGVEYYVAAYWAPQFPQWADIHKHLVIGCRKSQYDDCDEATKAKVKTWIRRALAGEIQVTIAQAEAAADDIGLSTLQIKLWDNPIAELNELGLFAPAEDFADDVVLVEPMPVRYLICATTLGGLPVGAVIEFNLP